MSINIFEIDEEELNKQIFKDFNKTPGNLNEYINIMREWAKTQPHFPEEPSVALLRFVVLLNKFSIERAKQKLDMYYTMRSLLPEFYTSQPLSSKATLQRKIGYFVPMPKTTPDFKRVLFGGVNPNYGPEFFDHEQIVESIVNLLELLIQEDKCYSFHLIIDCKGFHLGHVSKFSPMIHKRANIIVENVYSNRLACICLVNFPKYLETFLNTIVKPVLKPKIRDRIKTFPDSDNLLKLYDKSIMPKDIGGDEKSLDELNDLLNKKFEERQERFEVLRTLRVNESLRPQKLINDDILGYYGNFKNINVD